MLGASWTRPLLSIHALGSTRNLRALVLDTLKKFLIKQITPLNRPTLAADACR
jgi:hypothetical protein